MSNTITLRHGDEQVTLSHAVTSGKARVAVAKIVAGRADMDEKTKAIAERVMIYGEDRQQEAIKSMLEDKSITIDDVLAMNRADADTVEAGNKTTYALFRVACDQSQLTTEWRARVSTDAYLDDCDVRELEAFVSSFRRAIGV